jgi:hypothetical protein
MNRKLLDTPPGTFRRARAYASAHFGVRATHLSISLLRWDMFDDSLE